MVIISLWSVNRLQVQSIKVQVCRCRWWCRCGGGGAPEEPAPGGGGAGARRAPTAHARAGVAHAALPPAP